MPNKKRLYNERFTLLITTEEKKQMEKIANEKNKCASEILREALQEYLGKKFTKMAQ